jgi:hypothetical protein
MRTDILTIGIAEEQNGETTLIWQIKINERNDSLGEFRNRPILF